MASARSTVSIARTTPAQKPRGEQSTILKCGFGSALTGMGAISVPNHPSAGGQGAVVQNTTWDCFRALSRYFSKPLRHGPRWAYIGPFPSSPMTTDFASKTGGRSTKEICHEQRTADAQGDCRLAAR